MVLCGVVVAVWCVRVEVCVCVCVCVGVAHHGGERERGRGCRGQRERGGDRLGLGAGRSLEGRVVDEGGDSSSGRSCRRRGEGRGAGGRGDTRVDGREGMGGVGGSWQAASVWVGLLRRVVGSQRGHGCQLIVQSALMRARRAQAVGQRHITEAQSTEHTKGTAKESTYAGEPWAGPPRAMPSAGSAAAWRWRWRWRSIAVGGCGGAVVDGGVGGRGGVGRRCR